MYIYIYIYVQMTGETGEDVAEDGSGGLPRDYKPEPDGDGDG